MANGLMFSIITRFLRCVKNVKKTSKNEKKIKKKSKTRKISFTPKN